MDVSFKFNLTVEEQKEFEELKDKYDGLSGVALENFNKKIEEEQSSGFNLLKTQRKITRDLLDAEFGYLFKR